MPATWLTIVDRRPYETPVGLKMMVPGWPQFSWGQRQRGWVLVGSFAVALAVGLWTWGTWLGWGFFAFAFITQVTSVTDVLRQVSFPIYPSRTALIFVSSALALLLYFPSLCILWVIARPGFEADGAGSGFLVNCWAYHGDTRRRAKASGSGWTSRRSASSGPAGSSRCPGQEVEWTGASWRVDGHDCRLHSTLRMAAWPQTCRFKVPSNQILVEPDDEERADAKLGPLVLVPPDRIIGRAWAHFYPVWDRHLL